MVALVMTFLYMPYTVACAQILLVTKAFFPYGNIIEEGLTFLVPQQYPQSVNFRWLYCAFNVSHY